MHHNHRSLFLKGIKDKIDAIHCLNLEVLPKKSWFCILNGSTFFFFSNLLDVKMGIIFIPILHAK